MSEDDVDPLMTIAWRDFLMWAISEPDARSAFEAETGIKFLPPPRSAIERMVDEASDASDDKAAEHFAFWATSTQWGVLGVPPAFLGEMQAAGYALPRLPADGAGG